MFGARQNLHSHSQPYRCDLTGSGDVFLLHAGHHHTQKPLLQELLVKKGFWADLNGVGAELGERQSIAQKGVRAIDARNSQLENG